jgi:hypothetical protein
MRKAIATAAYGAVLEILSSHVIFHSSHNSGRNTGGCPMQVRPDADATGAASDII